MKIWVTRAEPGASRTAERLRGLGHEPRVAPVLQVRALAGPIDLDGVGALAFTSGNGVRAFADLSPDRTLPVFAVGEATAHAARQAGFAWVVCADADVASLAALIISSAGRLAGAVLFAGAAEPAGDLVGVLTAAGVHARAAPVYETIAVAPEVPAGVQALLVHSPKAAQALAAAPLDGLSAYCISAAAAAPLGRSAARILVAPRPDEESLLGLLAP
jgi:uroporphyrinogen-III synthase